MESWATMTKIKQEILSEEATIICFSHKWNPFAIPVSRFLAGLNHPRIFFVDIAIYFKECLEYGVQISPSLIAFVKGKPLLV
jgi:hypothetical protein